MNQRVHASPPAVVPSALRRIAIAPAPIALKAMRAADVLALQTAAGNRAARSAQRAMNVGAANDSFEKEADSVARDILAKGEGAQRAAEEEELQAKHVQRSEAEETEGEELQMKRVQRAGEEEELQAKHVQRSEAEETEGEELQMKRVQRSEAEETEGEELQMKRVQREAAPEVGFDGGAASAETSGAIETARGGGNALPDGVRREMEGHFGADFSGVRTHTGGESADLNQKLSARAFTTGSDIFVGREGLKPGSRAGKELLAHELTHVVQQGAARKLAARKPRRS